MKIDLTVSDEDNETAAEEMHKLVDDIWTRYPNAVVERTSPAGNKIEFEV